jgi:hypothetical protein
MKKLPEDEWDELHRMAVRDHQGRLRVTALTNKCTLSVQSSSVQFSIHLNCNKVQQFRATRVE